MSQGLIPSVEVSSNPLEPEAKHAENAHYLSFAPQSCDPKTRLRSCIHADELDLDVNCFAGRTGDP